MSFFCSRSHGVRPRRIRPPGLDRSRPGGWTGLDPGVGVVYPRGPAPVDPAQDPAPADPALADPAPVDLALADPAPGPALVDPAPVDPAPGLAPVDPALVDPAPGPAPVDPAPADLAPVDADLALAGHCRSRITFLLLTSLIMVRF